MTSKLAIETDSRFLENDDFVIELSHFIDLGSILYIV